MCPTVNAPVVSRCPTSTAHTPHVFSDSIIQISICGTRHQSRQHKSDGRRSFLHSHAVTPGPNVWWGNIRQVALSHLSACCSGAETPAVRRPDNTPRGTSPDNQLQIWTASAGLTSLR
ncbi:hypothetical protein SKAU_G00251420 [Synaphobranchus kaupii]|uniref:Uncharacterized protein n=1 Tax=Synaphobranchus kaupii TaxID=118154 RepID=A0A9Q1F3B3_SYNKA|nr:hypothetical protein SKAU_G00251420 [Synaphobranchus kaupii]